MDKTLEKITIRELAEKIASLSEDGKCDFRVGEEGTNYGVARQMPVMLLLLRHRKINL